MQSTDKLRVVVLYDQFAPADEVFASYAELTRELEGNFKPELRAWSMDIATSSEFSFRANDDIAAAELLIINAKGTEPCPAAFRHWQDGDAGGVAPHGIIVLVGASNGEPVEGSWQAVLQRGTTQLQPDVFLCDHSVGDGEWVSLRMP